MTITLFDNTPKRREKLVILAEIVGIARQGTSKTQIMFKANLSFSQLKLYLSFLLQARVLETFECNGRVFYRVTQKGLDFLEKQKQVMDLLNDDVPFSPKRNRSPMDKY